MKEETLQRVQELDRKYFGTRPLKRLIRALDAQVQSMQKEPSLANVHKQAGDLLFVLASLARNNNWDLDELLEGAVIKVENYRAQRRYLESHVTVEPVFGEKLERLKAIALEYDFSVANLLMQKRPTDTPERSANDSFCTGRGISQSDLLDRTVEFAAHLKREGFLVWRYKIEDTLMDSRFDDSAMRLDRERLPDKERNPRAPAAGALAGRCLP